jgi:hypothetical protein
MNVIKQEKMPFQKLALMLLELIGQKCMKQSAMQH